MSSLAASRGFTLFETLVATGILVTALAGIAQLFILGTHLTRQSNTSGAALAAAQDRLELLAGLSFGYDADGTSITDPLLEISPASSLDENTESYVDWLDSSGEPGDSSDDAVFVRRWRVSALSHVEPESVAIEVCAFRMPADDMTARAAEACLSTVRTRQP